MLKAIHLVMREDHPPSNVELQIACSTKPSHPEDRKLSMVIGAAASARKAQRGCSAALDRRLDDLAHDAGKRVTAELVERGGDHAGGWLLQTPGEQGQPEIDVGEDVADVAREFAPCRVHRRRAAGFVRAPWRRAPGVG